MHFKDLKYLNIHVQCRSLKYLIEFPVFKDTVFNCSLLRQLITNGWLHLIKLTSFSTIVCKSLREPCTLVYREETFLKSTVTFPFTGCPYVYL